MRWVTAGAAIMAVLITVSPAAAGAQERPFLKVGTNHWAYASVRLLEGRGYYTGAPEGTFNGQRSLTRYDFAVAAERIYRALQQRVLSAPEPEQLRDSIRELRRLLSEFDTDVADLGTDAAEMRRQVEAMADRIGRSHPPAPAQDRTAVTRALRRALTRSGTEAAQPGYAPSGLAPGVAPGLATGVGPAWLDLGIQPPDRLAVPQRPPFARMSDLLGYRAGVTLPIGDYSVAAYYNREGLVWDPYGLSNPYVSLGPTEGVGSRVSGPFFHDRLDFRLEAASLHSTGDDLARAVYFNAGLYYRFGGGLSVGVGYETLRAYTLGQMQDAQAISLDIGKQLTPGVRLGLLLKYFSPGSGLGELGGRPDFSNSSAVTQISVKF